MAVKRMLNTAIMQSTRFLRMSAEARCLYLGINMLADDEGVSEAYVAMLTQRVEESALNELVTKGFIKILDEDDLIVYVTDWNEHNQLRADRITPSIYHDLLVEVIKPEETETDKCPSDADLSTCCQLADKPLTNGGEMSADCQQTAAECQHSIVECSIGKDRVGNVSIAGGKSECNSKLMVVPTLAEVKQYVKLCDYNMSAEKFFAYHAQTGWQNITDWKAACDYWHCNEKTYAAKYVDYNDTLFIREQEEFEASIRGAIAAEAVNG